MWWVPVVALFACAPSSAGQDDGEGESESTDGSESGGTGEPSDGYYCSPADWRCDALACMLADDERPYVVALEDAVASLGLESRIRIGPTFRDVNAGKIEISYEIAIEWLRLHERVGWDIGLGADELRSLAEAELAPVVDATIVDRDLIEAAIRGCDDDPAVNLCQSAPWQLDFDLVNGELMAFSQEPTEPGGCFYQATSVRLEMASARVLGCLVQDPYDVCVPDPDPG